MKHWWWLVVCGLAAARSAFAASADEERAERIRIEAERSQVQATYAQREQECRRHFVVTSCLDQAQRERRRALEALRKQLEVLDEAQRKQRAAQRMEEIEARLCTDDAKRHETQARRMTDGAGEDADSQHFPGSRRAPLLPRAASASSPHHSLAEQLQRAGEYDRRQQDANMHREAMARRNAERASKGKRPAKSLPPPGAASGPASAAAR